MQRENSMLTFEQSPFLGTANIVSKLQVRQNHQKHPTKTAKSRGDTS
jgi:hypothetical protein